MLYLEVTPRDVYNLAEAMERAEQLGGRHGIYTLYDYYDELSETTEEPVVVDIVGWCSDWSYYSLEEWSSIRDEIDIDERTVLPVEDLYGKILGYLVSTQ